MKNIFYVILFGSFTQCTTWKQHYFPINGEVNSTSILEKNISSFINTPSYSPRMKSGDLFLKIILPTIPLSEESLSFTRVSGMDLISTPNEIDRAYIFSKSVDNLLIIGESTSENGSLLSEYYNRKLKGEEKPNNYPFKEITSATYNDEFYLTILNPIRFEETRTWNLFEKNLTKLDTFKLDNISTEAVVPLYHISMAISTSIVDRPWFKLSYANSANSKDSRIAYIEKIIFARDLRFENFSQSKAKLTSSRNGRRKKDIYYSPTTKIESINSSIIGYIYRIL